MCHPEGPRGSCVRHWSCDQVSRALQQLSPFSVAACEPLPSPYQAVQDMIFTGQEQLSGTYHASVTVGKCGLARGCHHASLDRARRVLGRILNASSCGFRSRRQGRSCWRLRRLSVDSCMPPMWSSAWRCRQSSGREGAGIHAIVLQLTPRLSLSLVPHHALVCSAFQLLPSQPGCPARVDEMADLVGCRVGDRILAQLLAAPAASQLMQVNYSDVADAKAAAAPSVQVWYGYTKSKVVASRLLDEIVADACGAGLQPARPADRDISHKISETQADSLVTQLDGSWLHGSNSINGGDVSGSYDSALAMLDGLAQPLLDPFVEGLKVQILSSRPSRTAASWQSILAMQPPTRDAVTLLFLDSG